MLVYRTVNAYPEPYVTSGTTWLIGTLLTREPKPGRYYTSIFLSLVPLAMATFVYKVPWWRPFVRYIPLMKRLGWHPVHNLTQPVRLKANTEVLCSSKALDIKIILAEVAKS